MPEDRRMFAFTARIAGLVLAVPVLFAASAAWAAPDAYDWGPRMMWGWGWPHMIFGPVMMLLVLVLAVVAVVLAVRWFAGPPAAPTPRRPGALDILNERFARGEIDTAEYETKRRLIQQA